MKSLPLEGKMVRAASVRASLLSLDQLDPSDVCVRGTGVCHAIWLIVFGREQGSDYLLVEVSNFNTA